MKQLQIRDRFHSINMQDIENLEKKCKVSFPQSFKDFLLINNGGRAEKNVFPMLENEHDNNEGVVSDFHGIDEKAYYSNLEKSILYSRVPNDIFVFASDPFGNYICIGTEGQRYGKVYFWDHEGEAAAFGYDEAWYENVYLIANSFEDFINSLYKVDLEVRDDNGYNYINTHDEYSLKFCNEGKRYGNKLYDFFEKSPKETQDFVIKEYTKEEIIELSYKDEKAQKQYFREIHKASGEIIREYEKSLVQ